MHRVLLVEDDANLREATQEALRRDGFDVAVAADGEAGFDAFRRERPDVVLLDVMLPGMDGVSVCRSIRAESSTPVVMLSARGDPIDVVLGLEAGADDARASRSTRRSWRRGFEPCFAASSDCRIRPSCRSNLEIDEEAMTVRRDGALVAITTTEFRLIADLAETPASCAPGRHCSQTSGAMPGWGHAPG